MQLGESYWYIMRSRLSMETGEGSGVITVWGNEKISGGNDGFDKDEEVR